MSDEIIKEVLMILQPRAIPEAIESLNSLDIEKVWFRGYNEPELCNKMNDFVQQTDYDYYWVIADDVIVDNKPLEVLRPLLKHYEVVSGYCRWNQESQYVNLLHTPIQCTYFSDHENWPFIQKLHHANPNRHSWVKNIPPSISAEAENVHYTIFDVLPESSAYTYDEIQKQGTTPIETHFSGWSFTGASRKIWLKYPFQCSMKNCESDLHFAARFVNRDGGMIYSHKDAYFIHLKQTSDIFMDSWLVGNEVPLTHKGFGEIHRKDIHSEEIIFDGENSSDKSDMAEIYQGEGQLYDV